MPNAATQHHPLRTAAAALREEVRSGDSAPEPTEHRRCEVPPRKQKAGALAILGYLAAVFVPVLGIVVTIPLLVRGESRHAGGVLLTVVVSFVIRMAILSNGGY
jgi:hypothetical protein